YRDSVVPLPNRFLAGGSTSLRGYGRNLAGPTDPNGNPLGGDVLLIGNFEYRAPLRGSLGTVLFSDIGNVFADPDTVTWSQVSVTVGLGVRYDTPIGPLRLDWGYLLRAPSEQGSSRIHFAIGQAF
ncbi:MAG: BamA/TamA family outer membrane protein, partial [Acidobacteriota bacterium]